ncbi:MAG TPA: ABC transporter permease [Pseudomonadales bacterium]
MHGVLDLLLADLRYAGRMLRGSPGFAAVAVLSLALGIGATTIIFSVVHAVVLDPFPYKDPDTLMSVIARGPGNHVLGAYYRTDDFIEISERTRVFENVLASTISDVTWTGGGDPERLRGNFVTTNTFEVMGVPPLIGRAIGPADGEPSAPPVVVLGYRFWQRRFGGDPGVLGQSLTLNGVARTVIGVMPRRFMWRGADVYVPIVFRRGEAVEGVRTVHLLGRLRPGVTLAQAEADLRPILRDIWQRHPAGAPVDFSIQLLSFEESFRSSLTDELLLLLGAVGVLLLIACGNVSNLLLARASVRQRELAIRASLGASRARLVVQMLAESLVLALAAGALGILLAHAGLSAVLSIIPPDTIPDESHVRLNLPVLWFALGVSVACTFIFGLVPALQGARRDMVTPLRDSGRGGAAPGQARARSLLVVAEVSLSVVLLVAAAMMMRGLVRLVQMDLGVPTERILTLRLPLSERSYPTIEQRVRFLEAVLERVRAVPGVSVATVSSAMPIYGGFGTLIELPGQPPAGQRGALVHETTAEYARLAAVRLVAGRYLESADVTASRRVAVVNERFVRDYFGDEPPIGRRVRLMYLAVPPLSLPDPDVQIVGVVADRMNAGIRAEGAMPEIHVPFTLAAARSMLLVRTELPPGQIQEQVRRQVYAVNPDQPVTDVRTLAGALDEFTLSQHRFTLVLFGIFAAVGLTMAMVGVYGLLSYSVARQTRELGVRIALGASAASILRMVLAGGLRLVLIGLVLGIAGGIAVSRLLAAFVWGATGVDPVAIVVTAVLLVVVGAQACLWPALRATRVNPMEALRAD